MKLALDASVQTAQSEDLRRWLLLEDDVLFRQATVTVGLVELAALANEYAEKGSHFEAAKCTLGRAIHTEVLKTAMKFALSAKRRLRC
jgi:hypothetical protein